MKTDNLSFVILGIILVVFAFWSASDTSFSSLKGIEHQETLKKITQCENSKTDKSFETYMTISSQFDMISMLHRINDFQHPPIPPIRITQ